MDEDRETCWYGGDQVITLHQVAPDSKLIDINRMGAFVVTMLDVIVPTE